MDDNSIMTFGKHKGKKLANVPAHYLIWFRDNIQENYRNRELHEYIRDNNDVLEQEYHRERERLNRRLK